MAYPFCESLISRNSIIAAAAIMHIFAYHFAIGGGLYLVLAETFARRKNNPAQLSHVQRQSRFFLLMTIAFGAAIGTGIWMTTRVIPPVGISWLTRDISLVWATGSVLFAVEFAAILLYYYGWTRLSPKHHLIIGWINFAAAWLSLAVINGILGFLLAPATWPETGNFWAGFFNPTFWPSLIFRTCVCLALAGLCATVTAAREKDKSLKIRLLRGNGLLVLGSIILAIPAGYWSIKALPPAVAASLVSGTVSYTAMQVMITAAAVLAFLTLLGTILFPRHWGYISAGILLLCGLLSLGASEWTREGLWRMAIFPDAANIPAAAQSSPFIIFAVTFGVGLIVLVWMLRTYLMKSAPNQNQ
ncbi:MAG: cytochrome ubiquinol oxidase subunit I [candidate division Zixibacteria bacterium]|nr:cytochrome ubiquinol oxidase subunit I [candidate division Zixibacteria bacterium]